MGELLQLHTRVKALSVRADGLRRRVLGSPHCQASRCRFRRGGWAAMPCPGDQHLWWHVLGGVLVRRKVLYKEEVVVSTAPYQGGAWAARCLNTSTQCLQRFHMQRGVGLWWLVCSAQLPVVLGGKLVSVDMSLVSYFLKFSVPDLIPLVASSRRAGVLQASA